MATPNSTSYWLIKSEGQCYSIDDLRRDRRTAWTGIRNYQARNYMRDGMKVGDLVLFYHSMSDPTGVYGIAKVVSAPHPDPTAKDAADEHYEPKKNQQGSWVCVDMAFVKKLARPISLEEIKADRELRHMLVARPGQRLSIMPVEEKHFRKVVGMV